MRSLRLVPLLLLLLLLLPALSALLPSDTAGLLAAEAATHAASLGETLPLWSVLPFAGMLLSIALFPLLAPDFWHHHFGKVSGFWALLFVLPFMANYGMGIGLYSMMHIYALDYLPFLVLLTSLFVITGGIAVRGGISSSPEMNTLLLLIGTALSSWIGTTGASMLMIRPLLSSNAHRVRKAHVVIFFIFLVSNIGGSLTPIGDPPLFLGFLHGVDFFWTLKLLPPLVFNTVILLAVFYTMDKYLQRKEPARVEVNPNFPLKVVGLHNLLFLGGVVLAVILSGVYNSHPLFYDAARQLPYGIPVIGGEHPLVLPWINLLRDGFMVLMLLLSLKTTAADVRETNEFDWFPIKEVAILFAGIFMTIIPALEILKAGEHGALAFIIRNVQSEASYFWASGILSSFLDNAPTYLTFFNTALGSLTPGMTESQGVPLLMTTYAGTLMAISMGSVFMGANSYIGNAPNFMVKSIAETRGVKMPSFFGYMLWSGLILIPLFLLDTWLFF